MYVEFVSLPLATQKDPICIGDPTTIRTSPVVVAAVVTERHTETQREREDSAVGELFVGSVGRRRVVCRGRGREAFSKCAVERICL